MIRSLVKQLPFTKRLIRRLEDLKAENERLINQLEQFKGERRQFIRSLYQHILEREPTESELNQWLQTNLSDRDLLVGFTESEEYQQRLKLPKPNNYVPGILTQHENPKTYLLYPSYDRVQLSVALGGVGFQLSDFNTCMDFLSEQHLLDVQKRCFLDVGANIGSSSIYAVKSDRFSSAISLEPSEVNYQFLTWNIQINNLTKQINALQYGVADFIGERNLIGSPSNCGDFRLTSDTKENSGNLFNEHEFGVEQARFTTLDELASQGILNPQEVGFIWMDCQGSEGLIFKGGQSFLFNAAVPIYVEFWPYGLNQISCKAEYFEFISKYSSKLYKFSGQEFYPVDIEFLKDFYSQNVHTKSSFDILILPR